MLRREIRKIAPACAFLGKFGSCLKSYIYRFNQTNMRDNNGIVVPSLATVV